MNAKLKLRIHEAISTAIDNSAEESLWDGWIHDELVDQMAAAAEAVFDSAMKAQKFAETADGG